MEANCYRRPLKSDVKKMFKNRCHTNAPKSDFLAKLPKKASQKGGDFSGFFMFLTARFRDGSRMARGPPKSSKNHKKTQIFYNMFKHFCTFGNRFFLRFAAQNSICFALPTSLFHRAAGQATRWNKSLGPPRLHSRSCFSMSVGFRKNI